MNGIDDFNIPPGGQADERGADPLKSRPKALTPVGGDHDEALRWIGGHSGICAHSARIQAIANVKNRIDTGVAGNADIRSVDTFGPQIGRRAFCSGEVERCEARGEDAIHLFGKRLRDVAGAKAGLHMRDWHAGIERGQRSAESGGGVPLHDRDIGALALKDRLQRGDNARGGLRKRLAGLHHVQILNVMQSGQTLSQSSARIVASLEPVFQSERPDVTVVQGDTTTTFCGALASFYARVPVAHVEAGLRTGDIAQPFPEEMNRVLTSRLASLHFAATEGAAANLRAEG